MKDVPTITLVSLDCSFGVLRIYCASEPGGKAISICLSVKDEKGGTSPAKVKAKDYLIYALNSGDKKNSLRAGDGDFEITAAFSSVEELLAYLKPYAFFGTRLRNRATEAA